ncbi:putative siderophore iron transporter protein [Podospora fimiseda]|uniref:Siderophore iron transporter protein n=1 Tax=Podospora fimiseda TaxID=252190 RepID=A0AAN7BMS6_9PEZI|nr:putative siderophore iron transporter protein [Podospora fimiseda]
MTELREKEQPTVVAAAETGISDSFHEEDGGEADQPVPRLHAKTWLAILAVGLIYMAQLVSLIGAGAQGQTIAAHFHDTSRVVWFSAPIAILTVVLGPIVSQAADYWSRKWLLVILTLFGAAGSIVVARATSINMLIPLLHVVTSEVLPRRWRAYGQASDMVSNAPASILGLYVGGGLNRTSNPASDGFRYYFYMTMGLFLAASLLCAIVYNPPPLPTQTELTTVEKLKKLDWVGYILLSMGLVLFSVGLSYSKNPYEWSNVRVSGTFAIGLAISIAPAVYETYFKKDGMFHHGLFTGNRNFTIATLCVFSEGVAFFAANTYFAFQINVLYESDALLIGIRYSLMMITAAFAACLTGWYCAVFRKVRWVTVLSFLIFTAFFAAMANTDRNTNTPTWGYPVMLGAALLSTPSELISVGSGIIISVRSLGGTIGLAIYNAVFVSAMGQVGDNIANAVIPKGFPPENLGPLVGALTAHNNTALSIIPGATQEVVGAGAGALLDTFVVAFRRVWIAGSCFVAVAAIIAIFLFDPTKEFNMHIDYPIEKEEELYSA